MIRDFILIGRSPTLSHVNASLQGLTTIRASNAGTALEKEFHEYQDHNTSCWYLLFCASRWFAVHLNYMCVLYTAIVTYSFLLMRNGKVDLILSIFSMAPASALD